MRIVIAGGTGFIGEKLVKNLLKEGHHVTVLTRREKVSSENVAYVQWLSPNATPEKDIITADVFINLAGVSINEGRWNESHQKQIYESRMKATNELIRIMEALDQKPKVLINASAIGIYPASVTKIYSEDSPEIANDFLGKTVSDWEKKAGEASHLGIRTVFVRFGVVLGLEGGALPLMVLPYKLFVGGTVGSGEQWVSWVHVTDVVRAISFAIKNEHVKGPVNVTAPKPVRMKEFGKTIGAVLHRPHWLPVPTFAMKLALGKKSALVLEGQNVKPRRLIDEGFEFRFSSLWAALEDLLGES
ncbi:TIGR01777 family oxidoreductase [Neobacillus sp. LXY-1]|uniref:TIGR01777 family oxidoreductase n=1 Tax=Neobacillus sp. LXY-1 TaxID=3379133 RepID=UPI003EE13192